MVFVSSTKSKLVTTCATEPPTRAMQNETYENDILDRKVEMGNKTPEEKR